MKMEAIFYEEKTNELTTFFVDIEVAINFCLGSNVTFTSAQPYRIATMIGLVEELE